MIDLVLMVVFSYFLHKMSDERGLSPWRYLTIFIAGFFLIVFAVSLAILQIYGPNIMQDPEAVKKVMQFSPFITLLQVLLFVVLRLRILKTKIQDGDDDETHFPEEDEEKDLSYFR